MRMTTSPDIVAVSTTVAIGPKSPAVTLPGLMDPVVTEFLPALIAMAVAPPEIAIRRAKLATTLE
jgi:hypothetical protein